MTAPISVVMSVYNTPEEILRAAIMSILNQTYGDFEFLIVDDCCNPETSAILREYEARDSRVRLIVNEVNLGFTKSIIRAVKEAKGALIARMDSDDVSMPERFARQKAFLERYPEVDVLGTDGWSLRDGKLYPLRNYGNQPWQIEGRILFGCQGILHPSVMMRGKLFTHDGFSYDENRRIAQDFDLWTRIVASGRKIYILPEPLLQYRFSDFQVTRAKQDDLAEDRKVALLRNLSFLEVVPTDEEKRMHLAFALGKQVQSPAALAGWAQRLVDANERLGLLDKTAFEYNVRRRQLNSALHTVTHRGASPSALVALFKAIASERRAKRRYRAETRKRGVAYPF